jgi:hypothetical protein
LNRPLDRSRIVDAMGKGIDWLWSIRAKNFGWGEQQGNPFELSGWSESLLGILKSGVNPKPELFKRGVAYLRQEQSKSPDVSRARRDQLKISRSLMWPIILFGELGECYEKPIIQGLLKEIRHFQIKGEGLAAEMGRPSNTYDTALMLWALSNWRKETSTWSSPLVKWLKTARNQDGGWGFHAGKGESNAICTALTALKLAEAGEDLAEYGPAIEWLRKYQRAASQGVAIEFMESIQRDWNHYCIPYMTLAYIRTGMPIESREVIEGVDMILSQQDDGGGWKILRDHRPFTHATAHSIMCLGEISKIL